MPSPTITKGSDRLTSVGINERHSALPFHQETFVEVLTALHHLQVLGRGQDAVNMQHTITDGTDTGRVRVS